MTLTATAPVAPAVVSARSLTTSIRVEPLTCAIGAELINVDLGAASRDAALVAEIRQLLLQHRVLFFRNQDFTRAEHVRVGQDFTHGGSDLLRYLQSQAFIPEFQVRWRWQPNSVAMWDNRSTQHYAVMDYPPCHRKMERAGIIGDTPF